MGRIPLLGVALLSAAGLALGAVGGPAYVKLDEALRLSESTGKLIALYTNVDSDGGSC